MRALGSLVLVVALATPAWAQREFIEDTGDGDRKATDEEVDLDAPDPATTKPSTKPETPTTKPKDPKATPKPETPKDPKAKDPKKPTTPTTPTEPEPLESGFDVRPTSRAAFLEKLAPRALAVKKGELARASKQLADVEAAELDFGMSGTPNGFGSSALGLTLAREAATAGANGRSDEVVELVDAARRAAPDDPTTLSEIAHVRFDNGAVIEALTGVTDIVGAVRGDVATAGSFVARVSAAGMVVVLALLALMAAVVALPALRLLAFVVWSLLPRGSHPLQGYALVGLAIAAPVVAGAGAVFSLLWVISLAVVYLPVRARVAVIVVGVFTVALPTLSMTFARGLAAPGSRAAAAGRAFYDVDGDAELGHFRALEAAKAPLTIYERGALAAAARREGRIDESLERWKPLVIAHPELGWVHGGYGTALATAGQDDLALAELGLAVERSPVDEAPIARVTSAFNASLLHHKANHADKAQAVIAPAMTSHAPLVGELRRATFRAPDEKVAHNRAFVDVLPPRRALVAAALFDEEGSEDVAGVADAIARPLWHGLDTTTATGALAGFVLLWAVLAGLAARMSLASSCVRCGSPASRRVDGPTVPKDTCAACFHAFISTKSRVEATVKMKKERSIFLRARRRARLVTALSVWPGAGHLFAGAVARGAVFAGVFALVFALAAVSVDAVAPGVRASSPWSDSVVAVPFVIVAVIVFLLGLRSALDVADDERAGGRR